MFLILIIVSVVNSALDVVESNTLKGRSISQQSSSLVMVFDALRRDISLLSFSLLLEVVDKSK